MKQDSSKILVDSTKRLLRRDANRHLKKIVNKTHAADLSANRHLKKIVNKTHAADLSIVFRSLSISDQYRLFNLIEGNETKGVLFSELEEDILLELVDGLKLDEVVEILETMPTDDVADLLGGLSEEKADAILKKMKKEGSDEVEDLLNYEDDTAGGIMVPDFIALGEDTTASEAIASLQKEHQDVEMPFYLYVVDEYGKLVGVSSLRQLVVVSSYAAKRIHDDRRIFGANKYGSGRGCQNRCSLRYFGCTGR
jgi:magnesium transporter